MFQIVSEESVSLIFLSSSISTCDKLYKIRYTAQSLQKFKKNC